MDRNTIMTSADSTAHLMKVVKARDAEIDQLRALLKEQAKQHEEETNTLRFDLQETKANLAGVIKNKLEHTARAHRDKMAHEQSEREAIANLIGHYNQRETEIEAKYEQREIRLRDSLGRDLRQAAWQVKVYQKWEIRELKVKEKRVEQIRELQRDLKGAQEELQRWRDSYVAFRGCLGRECMERNGGSEFGDDDVGLNNGVAGSEEDQGTAPVEVAATDSDFGEFVSASSSSAGSITDEAVGSGSEFEEVAVGTSSPGGSSDADSWTMFDVEDVD